MESTPGNTLFVLRSARFGRRIRFKASWLYDPVGAVVGTGTTQTRQILEGSWRSIKQVDENSVEPIGADWFALRRPAEGRLREAAFRRPNP